MPLGEPGKIGGFLGIMFIVLVVNGSVSVLNSKLGFHVSNIEFFVSTDRVSKGSLSFNLFQNPELCKEIFEFGVRAEWKEIKYPDLHSEKWKCCWTRCLIRDFIC
jgi:hypothetical protein